MEPAPLSADQRPDGGDCLYKFSFFDLFCLVNGHLCQFCPAISFALIIEGDFETCYLFIPMLDVQGWKGGDVYMGCRV